MQWTTIFKKEMLESWRNYKWIWVPLVMILIASIDPISNYYLPQIIDAVGGMPEGAVFELPEFAPTDVVMMSLGQFSSFGVLIIVLMSMGAISGERKSGVTELILVKPVTYTNYITAKWASLLLLVWTSLFLGMLASWYYVNILFGTLSFGALIEIVIFYGLWLTLVISVSIFYNTLVKTPGLVAFFTIATLMLLKTVTTIFSKYLEWSPTNLSSHIHSMLTSGEVSSDLMATALVTIVLSIALLFGSISIFKSREQGN